MATGTVLAIGAIVAAVASTTVTVVGTMQQAQAQKRAKNRQAAIDKQNAEYQRLEGERRQEAARRNAEAVRKKGRYIAGKNAVAQGGSGFSFEGTFEDLEFANRRNNELEAMDAEYQGTVGKFNSNIGAWNAEESAGLKIAEGRNAVTAGTFSAIGQGVSGLSKAAGQGYNYFG